MRMTKSSETGPYERGYQLSSNLYISVENGGVCKSTDSSPQLVTFIGAVLGKRQVQLWMKAPLACGATTHYDLITYNSKNNRVLLQ